jgi:hypothetical protein
MLVAEIEGLSMVIIRHAANAHCPFERKTSSRNIVDTDSSPKITHGEAIIQNFPATGRISASSLFASRISRR